MADNEHARQALTDEFGRRVRHYRLELGMSQDDLARECGLHRTYIGSLERGQRNVSLVNIVKLAAALQIDPSLLVGGLSLGCPDGEGTAGALSTP